MTTVKVGTSGEIRLNDDLRAEYVEMFDSAIVSSVWRDAVERTIARVIPNRELYQRVGREAGGVPWYFVAAVHMRERDLDFRHHLHNGDSLQRRTERFPPGRPLTGNPPFAWDESAIDALQYQRLDKWKDWTVGGLLFQLEAYNGFGYRRRELATPYLWSGTQHYQAGKYVEVRDPVSKKWKSEFRPGLVDKQIGTATLIRHMVARGLVQIK